MKYFRAKRDAYDYFSKRGVVEGELLTERQRNSYVPYIHDCVFDLVTINRSDTRLKGDKRFEAKHIK